MAITLRTMSFAVRGVIEGFYGAPWSHADRLAMLQFLGDHGCNAYIYAPKDDALHRDRWRDSYDESALAQFGELARCGREHSVRVGFAISPGLDIDYDLDADRAALLAKCLSVAACGIDWFLLALDDIPMRPGLASEHAALASWLRTELTAALGRLTMMLCPTEYLGTSAGDYTRELAAQLPTDIALMWTGPTVCSPTITTATARSWRAAAPNHDLVIWDNYPVNDGTMSSRLHLGPYRGRDTDLADEVHGILLNPMNQAHASMLPLATAAEYLANPTTYDADTAFARACGSDQTALFAAACYDGPPNVPESSPVHRRVRAVVSGADPEARDALHQELLLTKTAAKKLLASDQPFAGEVAPWAERVVVECRAGLAALNVLDLCDLERADVVALMGAMFAMAFHWSNARGDGPVVFGPRFALYPAIVMHSSGQPAFDAANAIIEDRNAIDALCRYAARRADEVRAS